ncbi:hypothetical protein San01_09350 [Streptomyces angustmyceticus]|uniref:Uncharacterized protein n=1 Tax=Streptomyces angustmyceticus TaxID=285578 RepID=A0A5J4LCT0_9ACTN|nr:hypothetical protein San01_09350 [Streptomyces angustmyceticus]
MEVDTMAMSSLALKDVRLPGWAARPTVPAATDTSPMDHRQSHQRPPFPDTMPTVATPRHTAADPAAPHRSATGAHPSAVPHRHRAAPRAVLRREAGPHLVKAAAPLAKHRPAQPTSQSRSRAPEGRSPSGPMANGVRWADRRRKPRAPNNTGDTGFRRLPDTPRPAWEPSS